MPGLKLSDLVEEQKSKPSPIRQIMKMASRQNIINMGLDPDDVISYGGGWVNHPAPDAMRDAYRAIIDDPDQFHKSGGYSPTLGFDDIRSALASFERGIFGVKDIGPENVIVGQSSTQITHDVLLTFLNPGDSVLLLDPTYANYPGQLIFAARGDKILRLPVLDPESWNFMGDVDDVLERFKDIFSKERPGLTVVPSPDNPTSQIPPVEFVKGVQEIAMDGGGYIALDFAYKTQYFDEMPEYYSWSPEDYPNVIALHSNSKWARGLGRRFGWLEASKAVIDGMERVQQCTILCGDSLHQMALADYLQKALEDGSLRGYLDRWRAAYHTAAERTVTAINRCLGMPRLVPQGGLYTCMDVGKDGDAFVPEVLKETGVLFIPGRGFGETLRNAVRISFGPLVNDLEKIDEGMERVGRYLGTM